MVNHDEYLNFDNCDDQLDDFGYMQPEETYFMISET